MGSSESEGRASRREWVGYVLDVSDIMRGKLGHVQLTLHTSGFCSGSTPQFEFCAQGWKNCFTSPACDLGLASPLGIFLSLGNQFGGCSL